MVEGCDRGASSFPASLTVVPRSSHRHSRVGGNLILILTDSPALWIPAYAGMTGRRGLAPASSQSCKSPQILIQKTPALWIDESCKSIIYILLATISEIPFAQRYHRDEIALEQ